MNKEETKNKIGDTAPFVLINKVKIGDKVFNIIYSNDSTELISNFEPNIQGKLIPDQDTIFLYTHRFSSEMSKNTLFHEILHGIDIFMGTEMTEEQVKNITNGIRMVCVDNKKLIKSILNLE